jgi:hypothetical protein
MAYETASSDVERFRAWICAGERILRCGQILRLPDAASVGTSQDTCTYQVISAEPYTFGLCSETTQTFLGFSGASGTDDTAHDVRHAVDENVSSEELEIDEAFLASSALQPLHAVANGLSDDPSGIGSRRVNLEVATMRVKVAVEDDYTIYLAAGDLTRLGLMSGDWVRMSLSKRTLSETRVRRWRATYPQKNASCAFAYMGKVNSRELSLPLIIANADSPLQCSSCVISRVAA